VLEGSVLEGTSAGCLSTLGNTFDVVKVNIVLMLLLVKLYRDIQYYAIAYFTDLPSLDPNARNQAITNLDFDGGVVATILVSLNSVYEIFYVRSALANTSTKGCY
jgi:hypothetical protein